MIKKLYPNGKSKAFNITYDDGVVQDIRFVQLLNKYNIKGTFNLNSQLMAEEFILMENILMLSVQRVLEQNLSSLWQNPRLRMRINPALSHYKKRKP